MSEGSGFTAVAFLAARRDRVLIPIWVYALAATAFSTAYSFSHLYSTRAARLAFGAGVTANPALLAITGRLFDAGSVGGLVGWRLSVLGATLVSVMSVLLVVRHSRAEEEQGRLELLRAGCVGRRVPLLVAVTIAVEANLAIALVTVIGLVLFGLPVGGSIAFAAGWVATGLCFAAVGALTAQLAQTSRAANATALATVGAAYLLRAFGDAAHGSATSWLSWVSPIGWAEEVRPFAGDRWAALLLSVAMAGALTLVALAVQDRRDLGAGLIAPRPGPARAGRALSGALGLAWRLQRGMLAGWTASLVVLGALIGAIAHNVGSLLEGSAESRRLVAELGGSGNVVDSFLAAEIGITGLLAGAVAILAVLRLGEEESSGRAETLLATPLARLRWVWSHAGLALAGSAGVLLATGVASGLVYGVDIDDLSHQMGRLVAAALVQVPAAWFVAGVALVLCALDSRLTSIAWAVLAAFFLLGELGALLGLPRWLLDISPFTQLPTLPGGQLRWTPIVVLLILDAVLLAAGTMRYRRRSLG